MGVPKFFRYISERYPCLSEKLKEYQIPEFDNLYLDMNGIIHGCSHPNDSDVHFRITEEDIFKNIFHYVEILFRMIQPQKLFFMAIDGVAPRAKINQQRGRRFRAAKDAELMEAKAKAKGFEIPAEKRFDSNCITPGTLFMAKLNDQLKNFITYKISTDTLWQKCKIIFSGSEVPGEGEHKIMDYIRYMKAQPDYDPNLRHCLYGLDADLIMLGLCTHEPHFSLLREEVKFGKKQKKILTPEETDFCLLHLSLLRDYISHEFSSLKEKLPFPFDIEKIIDDWVLIGFLVGNDFIPHLPNLHIAQGALPILYHAYIEILPTLDGYINEAGTLNLNRFEKFMENLSRIDMKEFAEHYADLKYFEAKIGRRLNDVERQNYKKTNSPSVDEDSPKKTVNKELNSLIKSTYNMLLEQSDDDELDDESDNEIYNLEFVQHKRDYYMNKMEYEDVDAGVLRSQAEGYVRAIQWNLHYYYNGCCSWSWYYPHHYAPYISDIKGFKDLKLEFDLGEPFLPFQQLLAVLPAYSKDLLPEAFQPLLTEEKSPIIDYYPVDFKTDLNGKRQEWEAVVLIPFINEKHLLDAMEPHCLKLTEEEQKRNKHGPMGIYTYTEEDLGIFPQTTFFPQVKSRAKLQLVNREDILVPKEKLVKGLCPGTLLDVYFPGFPTLQYIPHTATLEKAKVKVFEQPSRGENMILHLTCSKTTNLTEAAKELLGKVVNVDWPHFTEAQVVAVSNSTTKINLINPQASYSDSNTSREELSGPLLTQWSLQCKNIIETYKNRRGVDIGKTDILVHARPLIGSKYIFGVQGKIYLEKQWYEVTSTYAFQTVVTNIKVHSTDKMLFKTASEIFPPKTACFMLGHPHYGTMGEVVDPGFNVKTGRVRVYMNVTPEPVLSSAKRAQAESKTRYMHGGIAAQRLGISSHLLSRVTGTIYVTAAANESQFGLAKYNVGLNLKFNKRNEEIPGYTKKENGQWLYSAKAVDLIRSYMAMYPDIFEKLAKNVSHDMFSEEELFEKGTNKLDDITTWMKQQEFSAIESRTCGTEVLDTNIVQDIEKEIDNYLKMESSAHKVVLMNVKPHLLFKPGLHLRNAPPDPKAQHHLLDRVVCVRNSFTVPLGLKGTIIGIQKKEKLSETIFEVLFDKPFEGGLELNGCSKARAYRLSMPDFINISYGERVEQGKSAVAEIAAGLSESWRRPVASQNQTLVNPSAFASFSKNLIIPQGMPRMPLMMPNFKRDNSGKLFTVDSSGLVTAGLHLTNWKQRPSQQYNEMEANKRTKDTHQTGHYNPNAIAKPSTEFQALWNELHQIQKPATQLDKQPPRASGITAKPTSTDTSNRSPWLDKNWPQDPSAYLKAVLKIDDNVPSTAPPAIEVPAPKVQLQRPVNQAVNKSSDAPPLVQQLFDHARQTETTQRIVKSPNWYSSQLLNHFQLTGMGMPRYSYFTDDKTKQTRAQILLPDTRIFTGDFCKNPQQATENVARKVYKELHLDKMAKPDVKLLIPPPQQWFNNAPNNSWPPNVRPPVMSCPRKMHPGILTPMMHFAQWSPKMQQNSGYAQIAPQNVHIKPQQSHVPNQPKAEIKNSTAFVPLQAQKKSRNPNAKQSAEEGEKSSKLPNANAKQQVKGESSKPSTTQQAISKEKEVSKNIDTSQTSLSNQDKSQKHHYDEKIEIKSRTFTSSQLQKKNKSANIRQMSKESEEGVNFANQHGMQQCKEDTSKVAKTERQNRGDEKESDAQGMHHGSSKPAKSVNPRRSRVAAKFGAPPVTNGKPQIGKPQ